MGVKIPAGFIQLGQYWRRLSPATGDRYHPSAARRADQAGVPRRRPYWHNRSAACVRREISADKRCFSPKATSCATLLWKNLVFRFLKEYADKRRRVDDFKLRNRLSIKRYRAGSGESRPANP